MASEPLLLPSDWYKEGTEDAETAPDRRVDLDAADAMMRRLCRVVEKAVAFSNELGMPVQDYTMRHVLQDQIQVAVHALQPADIDAARNLAGKEITHAQPD